MVPVHRFVAVGWKFLFRQPALLRSTFLLVFLPLAATGYLDLPEASASSQTAAVTVVLQVAALAWLTWGIAATLTVGKRLLQAKAGRLRTSFKAVSGQARGLVVPLLLTDILRVCIAFLWGLPFCIHAVVVATVAQERELTILALTERYPWVAVLAMLLAVPPALYLFQTALAPMVVAYEKLAFRPALARSKQLAAGRLLPVVLTCVLLGLLRLPGLLAAEAFARYADPTTAMLAAPPVRAAFDTFALVLWLLGLTQFYKALGGKATARETDDAE